MYNINRGDKMKRIQIYFPKKLLKKIDNLAEEKEISRSELIRHFSFKEVKNND